MTVISSLSFIILPSEVPEAAFQIDIYVSMAARGELCAQWEYNTYGWNEPDIDTHKSTQYNDDVTTASNDAMNTCYGIGLRLFCLNEQGGFCVQWRFE